MPKHESIIIALPLPPKVLSPNCAVATPGGRFAKAAATKRYRQLAREAIEAEDISTKPWNKIAVAPEFFFSSERRRDEDNAIASLKAAYDGIVDAGLVADDDHKHMQRERPEFNIDRKHPRVMLSIVRLI